jgi:hypothetical protein
MHNKAFAADRKKRAPDEDLHSWRLRRRKHGAKYVKRLGTLDGR